MMAKKSFKINSLSLPNAAGPAQKEAQSAMKLSDQLSMLQSFSLCCSQTK
jgi:hypothetical protein